MPGCTANLCALFGGSYIELLGIVDESAPDPWHTKAMADQYEGFRLLNFDTDDAEAGDRLLTGAGLRTSGVLGLEREVDTEDGLRTMRARAVHVNAASTPEGYVGVAQHLTREYVHQPRYLDHPNGARVSPPCSWWPQDDGLDAIVDRYARILQARPEQDGPRTVVDMGSGQLEIVRASDAEGVLPGEPAPASSYLAAMTVLVDDVDTARVIVERGGTATRTTGGGFFVSRATPTAPPCSSPPDDRRDAAGKVRGIADGQVTVSAAFPTRTPTGSPATPRRAMAGVRDAAVPGPAAP